MQQAISNKTQLGTTLNSLKDVGNLLPVNEESNFIVK